MITYGPGSDGAADIGATVIVIIILRMSHDEVFNNFVVNLES